MVVGYPLWPRRGFLFPLAPRQSIADTRPVTLQKFPAKNEFPLPRDY
jgi:hypothetical protein